MRDHEPIKIDEFNGLWKRGDAESCPIDHFVDCSNVQYSEGSVKTRDGVDVYSPSGELITNVVRMYTYLHGAIQSILALDNAGNIYDTGSATPTVPILSIAAMTDFAFVPFGGRAYISPHDGNLGLQSEVVYVYLGDGSPAFPAAGTPSSSSMIVTTTVAPGTVENGKRNVAVVFEFITGFLSAPVINTGNATIDTLGAANLDFNSIPIGPAGVVKRHIVVTKGVDPAFFTGSETDYQFFFMPGGTINDNTTTSLLNASFFDAALLDDASHLLDNYNTIPAGAVLSTYHNRMIVAALFGVATTDPQTDQSGMWSTALVSAPGEPEAISQVDGLIVAPLDGRPITNAQEYRDVLYIFKSTRTFAFTDNGDVPSSWPLVVIDQGIGCSVHGIATVLDTGGVNVEFLLVTDYSGVMLFNGGYPRPELSYKIKDYWLALDRDFFKKMQIMNDSIGQKLYISLPSGIILYADYSVGLTPKDIKWAPWTFECNITTITLINTNSLVIGSDGLLP